MGDKKHGSTVSGVRASNAEGAVLGDRFDPIAIEQKWITRWQELGVYRWDPSVPRERTYVVDTPPPTVSGSLHVGHVFSYTHTDVLVRYKRMRGMNIMYPMGWDDNGLPTERRVQNVFGIDCNPALPYDPAWKPTRLADKDQKRVEVSRRNFIEACDALTVEDERAFADLWRRLGLSIDWNQEYNTIGRDSRFVSQLSFLDMVREGAVYHLESPTVWDVTFKTAVAQAELEERPAKSAFHDLTFAVRGGGSFVISTTRPELLAACIAVVAHPDDERYRPLFGKEAVTPLFHAPVPIRASEHADPKKGSGIMMICTFGDSADLSWWRSSGLPLRMIIGRDGLLQPVVFGTDAFPSEAPAAANRAYQGLVGKSVVQARKAIVALLTEPSTVPGAEGPALVGTPRPIEHPVKYYEKGDLPVEFVSSRQWYVRLLEHRDAFLEQGRKIQWHPKHMLVRYENWVQGLNQDWCVSRQRFFGVPFPVWYPVAADGSVEYDRPIFADPARLPVDPLADPPAGFSEVQRGQPGGFVGDPDVMDTWATSSMTPQIVSHWGRSDERHRNLFPADVRPQSHEIIRTWAFYTIVKAWFHEREVPWRHVSISGWVLDPDRKKMSKSIGNVVTPQHLLEKYSADGVRYWAARARLGVDTAFDEKVFEAGRKLVNKIFNASRFVLLQFANSDPLANEIEVGAVRCPLDRAWLRCVERTVAEASGAFEEMDHARALAAVEGRFWDFCDNYLELVKTRAYSGAPDDRASALAALRWSLGVFLRAFAPFAPFVTEEVWAACPWNREAGSIHVASWPEATEQVSADLPPDPSAYELAVAVLGEVRRVKGDAKKSARWPVTQLYVTCAEHDLSVLESVITDVQVTSAAIAGAVKLTAAPNGIPGHPKVTVTLGIG